MKRKTKWVIWNIGFGQQQLFSTHNLAMQSPQKPLLQMPPSTFLSSEEDVTINKLDCVVLVLEVLVEHVSVFSCFNPLLLEMKRKLQPPLDVFNTSKVNTVITLPLFFFIKMRINMQRLLMCLTVMNSLLMTFTQKLAFKWMTLQRFI